MGLYITRDMQPSVLDVLHANGRLFSPSKKSTSVNLHRLADRDFIPALRAAQHREKSFLLLPDPRMGSVILF